MVVLPEKFSNTNTAALYVLDTLRHLQNRGQTSAGIYSSDGRKIKKWKDAGKVKEIFFRKISSGSNKHVFRSRIEKPPFLFI